MRSNSTASLGDGWCSVHFRFIFLLWVLGVACLSVPGAALAQDQPGTTVGEAPKEQTDSRPTAVDRLIYIPYEKLSEVVERLKSKVVISYEEYMDLVKRANAGGETKTPQAQVVISSSSYSAIVRGEIVEITAVLSCQALQPSWAELPVQFGNAAVGELTAVGASQVLLRGIGDGKYALLFEKGGQTQVTLKLMAPVKRTPTGPTLDLTVPPVGITTFSLTIPKPDFDVTVSPRNIPVPITEAPAEGTSRVVVSLGATERISAVWVPKTSDRPDMDLLSTVTNTIEVSVRDGLVHTHSQLAYRILRGELTSLRIAVPLDQRILDVTSSTRLRGWQAIREEQRQIIEVELLGSVTDALTLDIHAEQALPGESLRLGGLTEEGRAWGIHALDVTREQGTLKLTHGEELTLVVSEQSGLMRTESQDRQLEFRYFSPGFVFAVRAEPVLPTLDVSHDALLVFREQRLETESRFNYTVRRAGVFHLDFDLPEGWSLSGVECPHMAEYQHDTAQRRLSLVLTERTQGAIPVVVRGFLATPRQEGGEETVSLENLPLLKPLQVRQEEGRIGVYSIDAIELLTEEDKILSALSIPTNQLQARFADAAPRAAWKFQSRPVVIPIRTLRRPTRMTAQTTTLVRAEPSGVRVESVVYYAIEYAGVDQFRIAVPHDISDRLQIEVVGPEDTPILLKSPERPEAEAPTGEVPAQEPGIAAAPPAEGQPQMTIWRIQTQRPVTGRQRFRLTYDLPLGTANSNPPDAARPSAGTFEGRIPLVRPLGLAVASRPGPGLTRSSGEVAVLVDTALSASLQALGSGLEPIDVRELTLLPPRGQQAYRYPQHTDEQPLQVELKVSRFDVESVVSTVVSRMLTEYVMGISSDLAVRSRLRIKSSQRQRLMLRLPAAAQPMLVMVNNEVRQLQRGESPAGNDSEERTYFVNVSRPGDSDEEFYLTVQYLLSQQPLTRNLPRGGLNLALPALFSPEAVPAVVQESRCVVWLPEKYIPVTVKDPFRSPASRQRVPLFGSLQPDTGRIHEAQGWIGGGSSLALDFPTEGEAYLFEAFGTSPRLELTYWNRNLVLLSFTLALLVIAFVLLKTGWENKTLVVIVVLTVLAIAIQFEPLLVKQGIHASRFGLLALLLIWLTHAVAICCQTCCRSKSSIVPREQLEAEAESEDAPRATAVDEPSAQQNTPEDEDDASRPAP